MGRPVSFRGAARHTDVLVAGVGSAIDFAPAERLEARALEDSLSQKLHRRTLLQSIVAVAATTAFGCGEDEPALSPSDRSRAYFPQSVASGEPRPDSVVLWTRAVDPEHGGDTALTLDVSEEESFGTFVLQLAVSASATHDHAVKVKVTNLKPRTTYYYRFVYAHDGERFSSPVGRTRTAPAAGDDVPVRFVFASCQDYVGRYYNTWNRLLQLDEDLDFVMFLGDYVYETTGDPAFQSVNSLRGIRFSEPEGALVQKTGIFEYYAAASLSNYRDLYKIFRADPILQRVHERYPFIVVWDDHEFSDDCWGAHATYEDERSSELQVDRRRNAEQAFFEFIPIDATSTGAAQGAIDVGSEPRFPDTRIYRDFEFGKNLRLIVTDYRTYRPDHLIAEDAYPGTVVMDAPTLAALGAAPAFASDQFAYINVDAPEYAQVKGALRQVYVQLATQAGADNPQGKAETWVKGNLALAYVNPVLAQIGVAPIPTANQPRGMAYVHMGKVGLFDIRGSRYVVVKDTFDLYAQYRYATSGGASENVLGATQEAWFKERLTAQNAWKVIVSSVSLTPLVWDLRAKTDIPDATLRQRFTFNADGWDGFPTKRKELLQYVNANTQNALFISGDIHASYASVEEGVPALTAPAISSGAVKELASSAVVAAGYAEGSALYRYAIAELDPTLQAGNPNIVFSNSEDHGFVVLEVRPGEALASFHLIPSSEVNKDYSLRGESELRNRFIRQDLRVQNKKISTL
ncbi:alkaline phosphatase D family protein [Stigmatella aurantiaca]|uniref:Phosphodiesterase I n=1 Tax=Stigmatella aurantiaca (strain DW4/3-1) TaxID=378806 RepID=Q08Y01_STIAD|nr:phosphodiesterase I [Stigmatella aurantiaca DW4/3-1]